MLGLDRLTAPWGTIALLLLLAAAALLVYALARGRYDSDRLGRMAKRHELPQTVLLIGLAAAIWLGGARDTALGTAAALVTLGVVLGFVGDVFMAGVFGEPDVIRGMLAFGLGHIAYLLALREYATILGLTNAAPLLVGVVLLWVVGLLLWWGATRGSSAPRIMVALSLVYGLLLATMAGVAVGLALQALPLWSLAIGGLLFVLSDGLIAMRLFTGLRRAYLGDVIWGTYIVAQALIVTGAAVALTLL